ncbi:helix-turn-helix domain-containing protein [Saccharothrix sp. Mg75]|uniref:helix-turn-helix domain-containing protein n=1 Tax=Saccharothrix sp. Mg75 TaxID=3445357 RepID=UPI003EEA7E83
METPEDEVQQPRRSSTAYTRWLGEELRLLRGDRRSSVVAAGLGWSLAKLSKLETGNRCTSDAELGALLGFCGVDAATREQLVQMGRNHRTNGFVCVHAGRPADNLLPLALHERLAVEIVHYNPLVVPAVLQANDYARAVLSVRRPAERDLGAAIQARIDRRIRVEGKEVEFFVNESALKPRVDNAEILAHQLVYLRLVVNSGGVRVRVIPDEVAAALVLESGTFSVLTLPGHMKPLVCVEMNGATAFLEEDSVLEAYRWQCEVLREAALSVDDSRRFIERASGWYENGHTAEWPSTTLSR